MVRLFVLFFLLLVFLSTPTQAACNFRLDHAFDETSAGQNWVLNADGTRQFTRGNWVPIYGRSKSDRLRRFGKSVGRLDFCWQHKQTQEQRISFCTGTLLKNGQVLTAAHCLRPKNPSSLVNYNLKQVRLVMGFDDIANRASAETFEINLDKRVFAKTLDAVLLKPAGNPNASWGGAKFILGEIDQPEMTLTMLHHPGGLAKQFNPLRCKIHESQKRIHTAINLRHVCDTSGGSSGALLLRESDLAIVGMHVRGGLKVGDAKSYNKALALWPVLQQLELASNLNLTDQVLDRPSTLDNAFAIFGEEVKIQPEPDKVARLSHEQIELQLKLKKSEIVKLQKALSMIGFDAGDSDGLIGNKTREAVRKFQQTYILQDTGYFDQRTINDLVNTVSQVPRTYDGYWLMGINRVDEGWNPYEKMGIAYIEFEKRGDQILFEKTKVRTEPVDRIPSISFSFSEAGQIKLNMRIGSLFGKQRINTLKFETKLPPIFPYNRIREYKANRFLYDKNTKKGEWFYVWFERRPTKKSIISARVPL